MAKPTKAKEPTTGIHESAKALLLDFAKRYGSNVVRSMAATKELFKVTRLPTGIASLDRALDGGIPMGKIIEIYGNEGVGKTSLALQISKSVMNRPENLNKIVIFQDLEESVDYRMAIEKYGLDPDRINIIHPDKGFAAEKMLDALQMAANNEGVCLVVLDSIAALVPANEYEKNLTDGSMAAQRAQLLHRACRKLTDRGFDACPLVFLNQTQDRINTMGYGDKKTTPGGGAMKFYASLRIKLDRVKTITNSKDSEIGFDIQATVVKARYSTPRVRAHYSIMYDVGIDCHRAIANMAVAMNVIVRAGSWYTMMGERYQGLDSLLKRLREDDKAYQELTNLVELAIPKEDDDPDEEISTEEAV